MINYLHRIIHRERRYWRAGGYLDRSLRARGAIALQLADDGLRILAELGDRPGRWNRLRRKLLAARRRGRDQLLAELRAVRVTPGPYR